MNIYCIYHKEDFDGVTSAAIIKQAMPNVILIPATRSDDFSKLKNKFKEEDTLFIVDFSLSKVLMDEFHNLLGDRLIWIDHHISAMKEQNAEINGIRSTKSAACILTWNFIFSYKKLPIPVKLLGQYDIWDLEDINTVYFQYGMKTYIPLDPNNKYWKILFNQDVKLIKKILKTGKLIYQHQLNNYKQLLKDNSFTAKWQDYNCIIINAPKTNSIIFDSVKDKYDLLITFEILKDKTYKVTVYTAKDNIDCSEIVKKFNGGGHKQASGFISKNQPEFLKIKRKSKVETEIDKK